MFGYLRFILAFLVLISHVDVRFYGLNPGVIAVVIFYMLAGYVVSHLWEDIIPPGRNKLYSFYKDRLLRILPFYSYVALLTILFLSITGYANPQFSLLKVINNFLIIPLNYFMLIDNAILTTTPDGWLIPPAWSLGTELQAYILLPFIFLFKKIKLFLVISSFCIYLLANLSILDADYFGYRLIFGVFFIFATGSSIQITQSNKNNNKFDTIYPWLLWGVIAGLSILFGFLKLFSPTYTKETFLGLLTGIPLIYIISKSRLKLPYNGLLGSLSYGVFLSHFLVLWLLDHTHLIDKHSTTYIPMITLGSLIISYSGVKILEKHIDLIRKKV